MRMVKQAMRILFFFYANRIFFFLKRKKIQVAEDLIITFFLNRSKQCI